MEVNLRSPLLYEDFRMPSTVRIQFVIGLILISTEIDVTGQPSSAHSPVLQVPVSSPLWVRHATGIRYPLALEVSEQGDVYVIGALGLSGGYFDGTRVELKRGQGFIAQYASNGELRWAKAGNSFGYRTTVGHSTVTRGDRLLVSEGDLPGTGRSWRPFHDAGGIMISEYNTTGDSLRSTVVGEPNANGWWMSYIHGLGTDRAGNIYIGGAYADTLRLHPDVVLAPMEGGAKYSDVFVASYTPEGDLRWGQRMGGKFNDKLGVGVWLSRAFAVDQDGNTYLGGSFGSGAIFGEGQPGEVVLEDRSSSVASFDAEGWLRWVRTSRDFEIDVRVGIQTIALDGDGNLFLTWWGVSHTDFSVTVRDTMFSSTAGEILFLTKHAPEGDILWARQIQSNRRLTYSAIATDGRGHVYVAGDYKGEYLELEGTLLQNEYGWDNINAFVADYDGAGDLVRVVHVTGQENKWINAISSSEAGELYIAVEPGRGANPVVMGADTIRVSGYEDMLLAKFGATDTASDTALELPENVIVTGNYPNPFVNTTTVAYVLPVSGRVRLSVYDLVGRELAVLVDGYESAGHHTAELDASLWPVGVYLYRLEAAGEVRTGRMLRVK